MICSWHATKTRPFLEPIHRVLELEVKLLNILLATLPEALLEWQRLLPRAEALKRTGCETREAWGRASAEFPELKAGRSLVELFLVWKTSTGNVERRFRTYSEVMTPQRASLLDSTAETMMLADQAPPSRRLRVAASVARFTDFEATSYAVLPVLGSIVSFSSGMICSRSLMRPSLSLCRTTWWCKKS